MERLQAAMRKAEEEVLVQEGNEVSLLVKDFFDRPVEAALQRMAGEGGRRRQRRPWRRRRLRGQRGRRELRAVS